MENFIFCAVVQQEPSVSFLEQLFEDFKEVLEKNTCRVIFLEKWHSNVPKIFRAAILWNNFQLSYSWSTTYICGIAVKQTIIHSG